MDLWYVLTPLWQEIYGIYSSPLIHRLLKIFTEKVTLDILLILDILCSVWNNKNVDIK
jgi:hypothetical protein